MTWKPRVPVVLFRYLFFGNFFYGICAVLLATETVWQLKLSYPSTLFNLLLFIATVLFYMRAYVKSDTILHAGNQRAVWYHRNRKPVLRLQVLLLMIWLAAGILFVLRNYHALGNSQASTWLMVFLFPLLAALYYGQAPAGSWSLRNNGWIKPFVIAFVWAGLVTVYPVLYEVLLNPSKHIPLSLITFFFLKNMLFISVLCIMFDIKDYAMDYNLRIKTFVVNKGLRHTIFRIIMPLILVAVLALIVFTTIQGYHVIRVMINLVPFLLLVFVALSLKRRKSIFFYLIVIDGLMLIKAVCGIIAMTLVGDN